MGASLRVTQVKSTISHIARNRATIRALGLHRIGDSVVVPDNDATRGMVRQVRFLVEIEEVAPEPIARRSTAATGEARSRPRSRAEATDAAATEPSPADEPAAEAAQEST
jgi:large subunit ribosomal protein L30